MPNDYTAGDLLSFLDHAATRGLLPAATAQALAAASRSVLAVLSDDEKKDLARVDIDAAIKRFANKRARDFNPASLKAYGQRVQRAVALFLDWRQDPANFTVKTRAPRDAAKRRNGSPYDRPEPADLHTMASPPQADGTYQSSLPVRPGTVVTVSNVPVDLTTEEADRLAGFIKMLAVK